MAIRYNGAGESRIFCKKTERVWTCCFCNCGEKMIGFVEETLSYFKGGKMLLQEFLLNYRRARREPVFLAAAFFALAFARPADRRSLSTCCLSTSMM